MKKIILAIAPLMLAACTTTKNDAATEVVEQTVITPQKVVPQNIEIDVMYEVNQIRPTQTVISYLSSTAETVVKEGSYKTVKMVGYTDSTGTAKQNLALSHKRAKHLENVMKQHGIASEKMVAYGLGAVSYKVDCSNVPKAERRACHDKNRRVEISVLY